MFNAEKAAEEEKYNNLDLEGKKRDRKYKKKK